MHTYYSQKYAGIIYLPLIMNTMQNLIAINLNQAERVRNEEHLTTQLRQKDTEIQQQVIQLQEKDIQIHQREAELRHARIQLQQKDIELNTSLQVSVSVIFRYIML